MSEKFKKIKRAYVYSDRGTLFVYLFLRFLIILCMIREFFHYNMQNVMLCILSLFLLVLPSFVEKKFKIDLPSTLEIIIFIFIFAAEILGEINNFYGSFPGWDTILHTINGFLCASIGFSLVYLLNENSKYIKLSPIFVVLVSFCFSMTVGVVWEFFEYGMDVVFKTDMQKDRYISNLVTVELDPDKSNNTVSINGIDYTILYDKNNNKLVQLDGYLDIGLHDTMKDLLVNFIGAVVYSLFGYLYIKDHEKHKLAGHFITKRREEN